MSVSKYKIRLNSLDKELDIPIEMKWDFLERDQAIDQYQQTVLEDVIGPPVDFELTRFPHQEYYSNITNSFLTKVNYEFYFFDTGDTIANTTSWYNSYEYAGFTEKEIYSYIKPFTKSFFKLDFYDTRSETSQKNYFTIILPVQQGDFDTVTISTFLTNVKIRKPKYGLDYVGDKEGFFIYWLRETDYIDLDEFYMSAKFFNARQGSFIRMMNVPQSTLAGNYYTFNSEDYFYYKVKLDYTSRNYEILSTSTGDRVGTDINPILWYEYVNP
jgi:hypothetical protein